MEKTQDKQRDAQIKAQLQKIVKMNPETIPIYYIINKAKQTESPEFPIMLIHKDLQLASILKKLNEKYPLYRYAYIFGKDHTQQHQHQKLSQKEKKRQKSDATKCCERDHDQKLIAIDDSNKKQKVGEMFVRYKDPNNMLVIIISQISIIKTQKPKITEIFFIVLALIFAASFIYLSLDSDVAASPQPAI